MPEASLALAEAALHLATAPKSNALYLAYKRAAKTVKEKPAYPVPIHLRNAVTKEMKKAGYGKGYAYAHDDPRGVTEMECLPEELRGSLFYEPVERGFEREIRKRIAYFEKVRNAGRKKG